MKRIVSILLFLFVLCSLTAFSQNENKHWIFLTKNKLLTTTLIFEDTLVKKKQFPSKKESYSRSGGFATISDKKTGELLFYTMEDSVFTHLYTPMDNINYASTASFGHWYSHSNLIVPFPTEHISLASKKYYLFHRFYYGIQNRFSYSIIDMSDGLGTIIAKNIPLRDSIIGSVTGTLDCSTGNYWVIVPDGNHRRFYAYRITKNGIDSMPIISDFNERIRTSNSPGNVQVVGYCKISPDGTKLLAFTSNVNNNSKYQSIYLYDFDKNTGIISNGRELLKQRITPYDQATVSSFSSNSKILYIKPFSLPYIYQYDASSDNIILRDSLQTESDKGGDMQLAMDKKIYYGQHVIHSPNTLGKGCDIRIFDTTIKDITFPNMMEHTMSDSYGLGSMRSQYCMEFPGTLDTVYGCVGTPIKVYHKDAGRVLFRKWTINNADIIEQGLDSIVFSVKQKGIYPIQLNSVKQSRSDVLKTVAIIDDIPKADAGKDVYACGEVQIGSAGENNVQYSWTPTEGLNNPNIPNPIAAAPTKEIKYRVRAFTKGGCENYDTVIVRPGIPLQTITITRDTAICLGNSVPLQAGGGTQYEWFPKSGLNNYFIANPIAMPSTTTRYKVLISNATCTDSAFVTITIKENEKANAGADKTLCAGLSVKLGTTNNPQVEYSWSPPDYLDNPNSATPLCTPQKNMQYILTVKNTNGCVNYDTVNITLGGELSVFAGADTTICKGETLQLSASGAENFSWLPTTGLSDPNSANPLFTGTSTTQYIVTGISGNCEGKDTIIITVNEKPTLSVSENREICVGDTVHLSASGASEYSWSPAEGLNNPTIANPIFSGTKTTEYTVTGKNGICSDSKKVLITVNNKPILSVSENREICAGDTVHLSANGASEYSWSPAEGLNNPTIANPIFSGTKTTEYTVTGKNGTCSDSKKVIVTVNEKPTLSASENREICLGDTVHLSASGADNYVWTPSTNLNNPFIANPIAQPTENITYTVRGTNSTGCFEEKVISIILKNEEEKIISLDISDTIRYAPGTFVPVTIRIPAGISQATMSINYDPCCVKCDSNLIPNNDISTISLDKKSIRFTVISPNKQEREIILPCMIYLPPDGRQTEKFTLSDIIHSEQCLIVRGNNDEILYDPSCAWQFRGVQGTGRFGIESDGTNARLYTGYGGNITLKIYDITGIEVWHHSSYYQSTDIQEIQLPTLSHGLYIMQASNGVWHDECVMMK